ncbi:hypothetical protein B0H13DRAFT_1882388 [Mycena leptocephala]|nr:hypothetical protein B0H13DRAFT_1882388 [Mycena leptocephala]
MSFSTGIWVGFRSHLAQYLGQQLECLVTVGTSRQVLDPGRHRGALVLIDFSMGPTLYVFEDRFSQVLPVQAWESRVWEIAASTPSHASWRVRTDWGAGLWIQDAPWKPVGYVEFDHRLYDDPSPIVSSAMRSHAIRLASRVEAPLSPNGLSGLWNIETFEARATGKDGKTLVLELGSKYISKRSCTVARCRAWLPGTGPDVCIAHLLMAPSFGGGGSPAA